MKHIFLLSIPSLISSLAFAKNCDRAISQRYSNQKIHIQGIKLVLANDERAIYSIRANQEGGDFQDEAVVIPETCTVLTTYNVWSE